MVRGCSYTHLSSNRRENGSEERRQRGWTGNVNEDKYPSRGLYWWRGSYWQTISEREEGIFFDLYSLNKSKEKIEISRNAAMPPGCQLQ